jgi:hypothetical protein
MLPTPRSYAEDEGPVLATNERKLANESDLPRDRNVEANPSYTCWLFATLRGPRASGVLPTRTTRG